MAFVFIIIFLSYFVVVFGLITGWIKAIGQPAPGIVKDQFISVVIAFRNEEQTIGSLITDLQQQDYPREKFEVILVNDHSEDKSVNRINEQLRGPIDARLVNNSGNGKKAAITEGINYAQGKIIVTTDADCKLSPGWLRSINSSFSDETIKLSFGSVKIESDQSTFSKMQALEFSSLVGSGASTAAFGFPTLCNGANLAFTKEVFIQLDGYAGNEQIASGDDEFLMRKIEAKFSNAIRFNNNSNSIVSTAAQKTVNEFLMQRMRWAGKWKHHDGTNSKLLAVYIFLFHLSVLVLPLFVLMDVVPVYLFISLFTAKAMVEYFFLRQVTAWLRVAWHWPSFLLLQVIYSFYAVGVAVASLFKAPDWKGRPVASR
jgi:poly-beta-1,6-N-acetyl-D-glucosamine synthase